MQNTIDCIVVMPQCPVNTFWAAKVESINKFIEQLISEYDVDKDRIYLTGLSMGGYGTWYTAMAKPDLFSAIALVCGGGMAWNADVIYTRLEGVGHDVWENAYNKELFTWLLSKKRK